MIPGVGDESRVRVAGPSEPSESCRPSVPLRSNTGWAKYAPQEPSGAGADLLEPVCQSLMPEPTKAEPETDAPDGSVNGMPDDAEWLMHELTDVRPDGYDAPDMLSGIPDPDSGKPYRLRRAEGGGYDPTLDGAASYNVEIPITKDGGTGLLIADVGAPGDGKAEDPCALSARFDGATAESCAEVTVDGKRVGVVTKAKIDKWSKELATAQWARYRHPDGTVVTILQDPEFEDSGRPSLAQQPFTVPELAQLAVDKRFLPLEQ